MESENINLENSCRLCLKRIKGEVLSVSIFGTDTICHSSIAVKIKTCVSIDVQTEDLLPQCICKDCHNKLDDFFAFKQVCLAADLQLKTLLVCTTTHNDITNDKGMFEGSYGDTIQGSKPCQDITIQRMPAQITISPLDMDMFSLSTVKTEPYYSEEECGLAEAMELDALSDDAEIGASTTEPSMTTARLPIKILDTFSLNCDNQRINETEVKVEQPEDDSNTTAIIEMPNQDVFHPIKMEIITEQEPLNENIPLAHYTNRKIIGVHNGNFIYNIDDEGIAEPTTERAYERRDSFRKNHRCDACGESFRRPSDLQAHRDTHLPTELRQFVCCVCPEAFGDKQYLKLHEFTAHLAGPHRCKECVASCPTLHELRQHVSKQHSAGPHRCKECVASCPTLHELRQHVSKQHSHSARCTCDVCGLPLEDKGALAYHRATAHRTTNVTTVAPSFVCDVCGLALEDKGALAYHRATAHCTTNVTTVAPLFVCDVCGLSLEDKGMLAYHRATAHRATAHRATAHRTPVCVTNHDALSRGSKMSRPADEASRARPGDSTAFSCEPCGLGFQHKGALICHQAFYHRLEMNRNVARAKIFTCEVCHAVFTRKDHYVIHKESHKYDRRRPTEENGLAVNQLHHFITLSQN